MSTIDLSQLAPPDIIETLDFEAVLAEIKADFLARCPEHSAKDLESDPVVKLLEVAAYRETVLRARINDGCRAVMLSSATGADLDQIGANYNVARLVVTPATDDAEAVMESNDRFRYRIQLAFEGFSTAGPVGAYTFHALSASAAVKDVSITRPQPGDVLVTILSTDGDGTPSQDLLDMVAAALNDESVRPLNDTVLTGAPEIVAYEVSATLEIEDGPDAEAVRAAALAAVEAYTTTCHALEATVARSGLLGALHQAGVKRAILVEPTADLIATKLQAPYCLSIAVEVA